MISFCQSLPVGNAVRVLIAPASGAEKTRLVRKLTDTIASEADGGVVFEGDARDIAIDDISALENGTPYYYRAFDLIDGVWTGSPSATATPMANGEMVVGDVVELVRSRLERGLKNEALAGKFGRERAYVPCLLTQPTFEDAEWPMCTLHINVSPAERGIGEVIASDLFNASDFDWTTSEGWIAKADLDIWGWAVNNGDLREALRNAVAKVLLGNMPIFAARGLSEFEFTQSNHEDMETYAQPVFQVLTKVGFYFPMLFTANVPAISDVTVEMSVA